MNSGFLFAVGGIAASYFLSYPIISYIWDKRKLNNDPHECVWAAHAAIRRGDFEKADAYFDKGMGAAKAVPHRFHVAQQATTAWDDAKFQGHRDVYRTKMEKWLPIASDVAYDQLSHRMILSRAFCYYLEMNNMEKAHQCQLRMSNLSSSGLPFAAGFSWIDPADKY